VYDRERFFFKIARNAMLKLLWETFDIFDDIKKEREEQATQLKKDLEAHEARRAQERQAYFKEQQLEPFPALPPLGRGMNGGHRPRFSSSQVVT
jgi:hypothetical protein